MNVLDSFRLDGKVAVVAGGAGLYSRQIVEALAEVGAKTFSADYDLDKARQQAEEFRKRGLDVTALHFDQGSEESINALLASIIESAGRLDVAVNSAVMRSMADWSSPAKDFARSMEVNATGMFMLVRTFGDYMAEHDGGSIINIGSIAGMIGPDFSLYEGWDWETPPDYGFHKAGMLQLTRFAASKLGPRGVRVNTISPGGLYSDQPDEFVRRYSAKTFLGRMANETDLKGIIVFLASGASAYITGTNIPMEAGYTAK